MSRPATPTIVVHRVSVPGTTRPVPEATVREALEGLSKGAVEACSDWEGPAIACGFHPFISTLHTAFVDHRPVVFSPDMFWLLVAQGFGRIVNQDPEGMREHFVTHTGKVEIEIRRDHFVMGSPDNDWPGVFTEFSEAIREHVGADNHDALVATFSTTGPVERAANEVVLLSAMQSYFTYAVMTLCDIPEIHLEGTPEDWQSLAARVRNLRKRYDCAWWLDHVVPLLDRIAESAAGRQDPAFWNSIYKWEGSSFGLFSGGWVVQFFPYLQPRAQQLVRNHFLGHQLDKLGLVEEERDGKPFVSLIGVETDGWPGSLSVAPFTWEFLSDSRSMEFVAGFTHMTQDKQTLMLRPAIGWAVRSAVSPPAGTPKRPGESSQGTRKQRGLLEWILDRLSGRRMPRL